ncbi:aspartate-semialdehyde dehydrogenase [Candidatus Velamenicoccus archaeovorus]|uniref:Aspartate-semialdehyde dehydrogenase n=1 Tax=Velamenicoccus archaeovorus TaxID=1930593 RepID=A0A410P503_VELA1|nr:aspartate-semialdehyde dehydrogenase [Candidatus Velamenicoccus archaeovorus]QAT17200.1 aspartate-semialdehyde dehydrogenase [Candidatus Velamenicoccus archaeovorus]
MKTYNIAVVGVGAVGIEMLKVLKSRNFPVGALKVLARSERDITVDGQTYHVKQISPEAFEGVDIALFAGTEGEKGAAVTFAPEAVKRGAVVIDNGADFRMEEDVPLVVPEVNPKDVKKAKKGRGIIANPNCSTIQMVVALAPIHKLYKIRRVIVSTYQAASGAGSKAVAELFEQTKAILSGVESKPEAMPQRIAFNIFPHIGGFAECDYTSEEWKMIKETHKIMHTDRILVSATTVRVPVRTGHSESIYIETKKPVDIEEVKKTLASSPGIVVLDDTKSCVYPLPVNAEGKDEVFVGRLRKDPYNEKGMWMWVVADNLRKGAATNAVQIAELLIKR